MELRQLEYFAAVVRHRHFGRAAEDVYVTQSALSQQIAKLEQELGLTLLVRSPQGVEPTAAGYELAEHARAILEQVAHARAAIDEHVGALRGIGRVATTVHDARGLPGALVAFHRAHPRVQLALRQASAPEVIELVARGAADVAVVGIHEQEPRVPPGIAVRAAHTEPLRLIGAADEGAAGGPDITFADLRGRPVILPERGTALRALIAECCTAAGFSPLPLLEASDPGVIRHLAAAGLGVAVVPGSWVDADGPPVAVRRFAGTVPEYRVALLSTTTGRLPIRDALVAHLAGGSTSA